MEQNSLQERKQWLDNTLVRNESYFYIKRDELRYKVVIGLECDLSRVGLQSLFYIGTIFSFRFSLSNE